MVPPCPACVASARICAPDSMVVNLAFDTLVLKPEFSRFAASTLVRPTPRAIARLRPCAEMPWVVQPFIAGEEVCLWSAVHRGAVTALAIYRPRWRHGRITLLDRAQLAQRSCGCLQQVKQQTDPLFSHTA